MSDQQDLLSGLSGSQPRPVKDWYFVTNQRNLFYILAAGMVIPPSGFGGKYYQDPLAWFPGWAPVFPNKLVRQAAEHSVSEKPHLIACAVNLELSHLNGPIKVIYEDGSIRDEIFSGSIDEKCRCVLIPLPIPTACVSSIVFETKENQVGSAKDAGDFDNVDLSGLALKVSKQVFEKAGDFAIPAAPDSVPVLDVPLTKVLAAGGMLAMLFHLSNRFDLAIEASILAFEGVQLKRFGSGEYRIVSSFPDWLDGKRIGEDSGKSAGLYWAIIDAVIRSRHGDVRQDPRDAILDVLYKFGETSDENKASLILLVQDLKGLLSISDNSVTDLMARHTKPLPRSLILFFLRETCVDLLDFRHPLLNEYDYIAAAMLFGARDTWLRLPVSLRKPAGLAVGCSHKMAAISHKLSHTSIDLGSPPSRVNSLRELLREDSQEKAKQEASLLLARKSGWNCVSTKISLAKGKYGIEVDGQGVHFILEGEPKAVRTLVDHDTLLARLAENQVPWEVEREVRQILGSKEF